jgi:hypothetical protein
MRSDVIAAMTETPLKKPLVESTDEWEMVHFFEMKYNRLIAFNSSLIHKSYRCRLRYQYSTINKFP